MITIREGKSLLKIHRRLLRQKAAMERKLLDIKTEVQWMDVEIGWIEHLLQEKGGDTDGSVISG